MESRCSVVLAAGMLVETATGPAASGAVAAAPPNLAAVNAKLVKFATGLSRPIAIAWRKGDARLYVAEQGGKVRIVSGGHPVSTVLDLTAVVATGGEQGLLGITFSPDGTKLYADFTNRSGDIYIYEWTMQGDVANRATGRALIGISHHVNANHNSGQILFGADNMLYASVGDGGGAGDQPGNAQNLGTLLGKIIRIDPRPLGLRPVPDPARQPVRRPGREAPRDLDVRAAQRVAVDVRPRDARHVDRRRRPGVVRGGRLRAGRHEGHQLGLEPARGLPPVPRPAQAARSA